MGPIPAGWGDPFFFVGSPDLADRWARSSLPRFSCGGSWSAGLISCGNSSPAGTPLLRAVLLLLLQGAGVRGSLLWLCAPDDSSGLPVSLAPNLGDTSQEIKYPANGPPVIPRVPKSACLLLSTSQRLLSLPFYMTSRVFSRKNRKNHCSFPEARVLTDL